MKVLDVLLDRLTVVSGDITKLAVDAIVTAANEALCGGGGVDGAVHRAAGPGLLAECLKIGHCPTGAARITGGHLLQAKYVIHAVGPVWEGGTFGEREILHTCYRSALSVASDHQIGSIAFPCISTGTFGYPKAQACEVAVAAVTSWLEKNDKPTSVVFCCFEAEDARLYRKRLGLKE